MSRASFSDGTRFPFSRSDAYPRLRPSRSRRIDGVKVMVTFAMSECSPTANENARGHVRCQPNARSLGFRDTVRMAQRSTKRDYQALREKSGWYAAAWRDFNRLSLDELAAEVGTSKSHVSDMERGEKPWHSEWLVTFSRALNTRPGHLIDVDPFAVAPDAEAFLADFNQLDERGRRIVLASLRAARGGEAA